MTLESGLEVGYVWLTRECPPPGHVREMPLEFGLEAGYILLTREKAERPNMSGLGVRHVQSESLESG
jgi:hypothetical protein